MQKSKANVRGVDGLAVDTQDTYFGEFCFVADSRRAFIPLDAAENNLYKNVYSVEEECEEMNEEALACIEEYVYKAEKESLVL